MNPFVMIDVNPENCWFYAKYEFAAILLWILSWYCYSSNIFYYDEKLLIMLFWFQLPTGLPGPGPLKTGGVPFLYKINSGWFY
jgi:hypothetical protein